MNTYVARERHIGILEHSCKYASTKKLSNKHTRKQKKEHLHVVRGFRAQFHRPKRNRQNPPCTGASNHVEQVRDPVPARQPAQVLEEGNLDEAAHPAAVQAQHAGAGARRQETFRRTAPLRVHRTERAADQGGVNVVVVVGVFSCSCVCVGSSGAGACAFAFV